MITIKFKRGDTLQVRFDWADEDGVPVDLDAATAKFQARTKAGTLLFEATSAAGDIVFDDTNGYVYLAYENTANLTPGTYECDMEVTFPTGIVASTPTYTLLIQPDISRTE